MLCHAPPPRRWAGYFSPGWTSADPYCRTRAAEMELEQEVISLDPGFECPFMKHTTVTSGINSEVKVHKGSQISKSGLSVGEMKKAMYSVEIKVERDRVTGETRILSTNTTLPVDLSDLGVKVYEDDQKVVHEVNGEDGVQMLSSLQVDELLYKADEASMMSQTTLPKAKVQEESGPSLGTVIDTMLDLMPGSSSDPPQGPTPGCPKGPALDAPQGPTLDTPKGHFLGPRMATEITGLEANGGAEQSVAEPSADNPVTMVFMGYQNVEDQDETKKVLGLQGTVKAELVLIDDVNRKVDSNALSSAPSISTKPPQEKVGEKKSGTVEVKEKQSCKCCSIM
uniref:Paralemmin-1 n=2 Tax=Iconisemion striatum TaxID=60296 RepID=A0A1A7XCT6_9TELE